MADTFFPACLESINQDRLLAFAYHQVIFPESVAKECPEFIWNVQKDWEIRQPCLLLAGLWGIWIGYQGFRKFYSSLTQRTWAIALLTFGIMNVTAVPLHCLWKAPAIDYPTNYPILWTIDTYMTGVSGSCLLISSLKELQVRCGTSTTTTTLKASILPPSMQSMLRQLPLSKLSWALQIIGILCIIWFAMDPVPQRVASSHPLELWYLIPPLAAGIPVLMVLYEDIWLRCCESYYWHRGASDTALKPLSLGQAVFALSIFLTGIVGGAMDRVWCPLLGYSLARDFLSANTFVFLGCDLAFWGLARFLLLERENDNHSKTISSTTTKKQA